MTACENDCANLAQVCRACAAKERDALTGDLREAREALAIANLDRTQLQVRADAAEAELREVREAFANADLQWRGMLRKAEEERDGYFFEMRQAFASAEAYQRERDEHREELRLRNVERTGLFTRAERAEGARDRALECMARLLSWHHGHCNDCSADEPCAWAEPLYATLNRRGESALSQGEAGSGERQGPCLDCWANRSAPGSHHATDCAYHAPTSSVEGE